MVEERAGNGVGEMMGDADGCNARLHAVTPKSKIETICDSGVLVNVPCSIILCERSMINGQRQRRGLVHVRCTALPMLLL